MNQNTKQQIITGLSCLVAGAGIALWLSSKCERKPEKPLVVPGQVQVIHSKDTTINIVEWLGGTRILKPEIVIVNPETIRLTDSVYQTPPGHIPASLRRLERAGDRLAIVYCLDTIDSEGIVWSQLKEYQFKVSPWNDYIVAVDAAESLNVKTWEPLRWGFGLGAEGGAYLPSAALSGPVKGYYTPVVQIWAEKGPWRLVGDVSAEGIRANLVWRIRR